MWVGEITVDASVKENGNAIISDKEWQEAKDRLDDMYRSSRCLPILENCMSAFSEEYPTKYLSDLENFIKESKIEDFGHKSDSGSPDDIVTVSTIHKSKGHEYDNVFISLKGLNKLTDDERRAIYVAITRAKNNLSVHFSQALPLSFKTSSAHFMIDRKAYDAPSELMMQLSHRDVFLGFFKNRTRLVKRLYSGCKLKINGDCLSATFEGQEANVVRFSENFCKKVADLRTQGYELCVAQVRFIVYWEYKETLGNEVIRKEIPIVLPDLLFRKSAL